MSKTFDIRLSQNELGNWEATQIGDTFTVDDKKPGGAVAGLIAFLTFWDEEEE